MKKYLFRFLILILSAAVVTCKNPSKKKSPLIPDNALDPGLIENPQSASGKNNPETELPVFKFQIEKHNFGTITQGEKISYSFQFTNTGNADLIVSSAAGSCGCTVPEYSREPVPPGKSGIINVIFDSSGKDGHQEKTVTIVANTIPNSKVITISGDVIKQK